MRDSTLLFLIGPPAVGKMAVGQELARRTGLKLFHNHMTVDLALRFFPETELRLAEKPPMRDVQASRERLLHDDAVFKLSSTDELRGRADYLRIDNTSLSAADAADLIVRHFHLRP